MPADWEPAPPSARLNEFLSAWANIQASGCHPIIGPESMPCLREIAADVAAMERRLAEYARKERGDAE